MRVLNSALLIMHLLYLFTIFTEEIGIKVIPNDIIAMVGYKVTFKCTSNRPVTWTFKTGQLPPNAEQGTYKNGSLNQWLTITNVQIKNSGNYRCYGEVGDGENSKIYKDQGVLTVAGKNTKLK